MNLDEIRQHDDVWKRAGRQYISIRRFRICPICMGELTMSATCFPTLRLGRPVASRGPSNEVPFPFRIRRTFWLLKLLFFDDTLFSQDLLQLVRWNRDAYLMRI